MNDLTICHNRRAPDAADAELLARLDSILIRRELHAVFQPIFCMDKGRVHGYEGLVRGPSDTPLHAPDTLFRVASQNGRLAELEKICRQVVMRAFVERKLAGKLFLNVSPQVLLHPAAGKRKTIDALRDNGLRPEQVVIELTENHPIPDYMVLRDAAFHYRALGFEIAVDDLGEGFSSLRLWSELHPDYIKVDKHFARLISMDPVRQHFVRSIQALADDTGTRVVAEGIETHADLVTLWELGVSFGQGFYLARPDASPPSSVPEPIEQAMRGYWRREARPRCLQHHLEKKVWRQMVRKPPPVEASAPLEEVFGIFKTNPAITDLPVFSGGRPAGIINRNAVQALLVPPLGKEMYGSAPCSRYMDASPLILDASRGIEEIGGLLAARGEQQAGSFLVTQDGQYAGIATIHGLVREIVHAKTSGARYTNPLTALPGNVPANEFIDQLLKTGSKFHAWHCGLNHFKPFNDAFGYRRGDEILLLTAQILSEACERDKDFLGHLGGDDFIMVMRSRAPKQRCLRALAAFEAGLVHLLRPGETERGGYDAEDRKRKTAFHPLPSLAIGGMEINPKNIKHHSEVFGLITDARKHAKQRGGNALFVARRKKGGK